MKWLKIISALCAVAFITLILLIEVAYWYGLKGLPENSQPSQAHYSNDLLYVQWVDSGGSGEIKMQKKYLEQDILTLIFFAKQKYRYKSNILAQAARVLMYRKMGNQKIRMLNRTFYSIAFDYWISQHWTAQEALNTVLDSSSYGKNMVGIRAAAQAYFQKMPNQLNQDEIVFLVSLSRSPGYFDPICHSGRLLERMNFLKERLATLYPTLYAPFKPITTLPFQSLKSQKCSAV
jgi:hypothetical protein